MRPYLIYIIILISVLFAIPSRSFSLECIDTRFLFDINTGANQPSDIALDTRGRIYLVDGVNNRIVAVDSNGRWRFEFGSEGSGKGQFRLPLGIDVSDSGRIFVADTGNHRIQVFDPEGRFLYMFTVRTGSGEVPANPVDVAISKLNEYLYVSDNDNHVIKVYRQNGTYDFTFGKFGEDFGSFRFPGIMTLNEYNEVFVVDVLNTRVQKFDPFGKFIVEIGDWGVLQGKLFRPKGVALDRKSRVFVSDSYMGVIQAFTDLGRFIGVICEHNRIRRFKTPVGIVVDKNDRLLIVEMRAGRITVMKILE